MPSKQQTSRRRAGTASTETAVSRATQAIDPVTVVTHGEISEDDLDYARRRLTPVVKKITEPVLLVRIKLTLSGDPGRSRPAIAQVMVDINGDLVRAHNAAETMPVAIDLVRERLQDQLDHRSQRRQARRRRRLTAGPGEWRHGDLPTAQPDYYDRPIEQRKLVRRKTFAIEELTPEEAVFDMEQMDFDFYLFTEIPLGEDAVVERQPESDYRLRRLHPTDVEVEPGAVTLAVFPHPPPRLLVDDAMERLEAIGTRFLFFANVDTDRGNVVYHRYDGHYGLITPA